MSYELANFGLLLANDGYHPLNQKRVFSKAAAQTTKAIMSTCGLYDYSGRFAVKVGLPGKSGVGGGIVCSAKDKMGIATFGPSLDSYGNSIAGMHILESLSKEYNLSIY